MPDLTWAIIVCAILCTLAWGKHREKPGKKVSWYTDFLIAGGLAFAANFVIGFGESFIPSFMRSFLSLKLTEEAAAVLIPVRAPSTFSLPPSF